MRLTISRLDGDIITDLLCDEYTFRDDIMMVYYKNKLAMCFPFKNFIISIEYDLQ
jgi:hypothetical protein